MYSHITPNDEAVFGLPRAAVRGVLLLLVTGWELLRWRWHRRGLEADQMATALQPFVSRWCARLLRIFGVEVQFAQDACGPTTGARLVVANHRSPIDIAILLARFGGIMVSRHDLAEWPLLGPAAKAAGVLFVDRGNPASGLATLRRIRSHLEAAATIVLFPEGRVYPGHEVRPFHHGAFAAARGLPVEIVPVGLAYPPGAEFVDATFFAHVMRVARRRRTPVAVCIGSPFPAHGSAETMAYLARQQVQQLVDAAAT